MCSTQCSLGYSCCSCWCSRCAASAVGLQQGAVWFLRAGLQAFRAPPTCAEYLLGCPAAVLCNAGNGQPLWAEHRWQQWAF
jgi:hypothetical protein